MSLSLSQPSAITTTSTSMTRGQGFMPKEDLLIFKAFITASEDPIVGTSQKGKHFNDAMCLVFGRLTKAQFERRQEKIQSTP